MAPWTAEIRRSKTCQRVSEDGAGTEVSPFTYVLHQVKGTVLRDFDYGRQPYIEIFPGEYISAILVSDCRRYLVF